MPTSVSQLQQITDNHGFIELMVLDHASFTTLIYLVNDTRDWTIGGQLYVGLPFAVKLPSAVQKENPRAQIRIDNVGRSLTAAIEALPVGAALTATLQMVSRATPTVVDYAFVAQLSGIELTTSMMTASMGPDDTMRQSAVRIRFDPANTPGLFAG